MNRYQPIPIIKTDNKPNYQTTRYPEIPLSDEDIYVYASQGDRFDILANQYYGDQSLWWIISIANTAIAGTSLPSDLNQSSLVIPEGMQIRIPANYAAVLNSFKQLNSF
jgi:phage tail protein X